MTTFPLATLACTLDANGISAPSFNDALNSLIASAQSIFGSDIVLTPDSQDGQFLSILAQMITDGNNADIATYNAYSPVTAQGVGLSSVIKLNAMERQSASNSTCPVVIVGTAQTAISNGIVSDTALPPAHQWSLPALVTIPNSGTITVTATCNDLGAVQAPPGTLTNIVTPLVGWQAVTNAVAATAGNPVEQDATVRQRQARSTAQPANSILDGIIGAIGQVAGVTEVAGYQNSTSTTDGNGVPSHTIVLIVKGGTQADVATAIANKKPPGVQTYGSTSVVVFDQYGVPEVINFFVLGLTTIYFQVTIKALTGYSPTTGTLLMQCVAAAISALSIGGTVYVNRLFAPANLSGAVAEATALLTATQLAAQSATYNVTQIKIGYTPGVGLGTADLPITYNMQAISDAVADGVLVVT